MASTSMKCDIHRFLYMYIRIFTFFTLVAIVGQVKNGTVQRIALEYISHFSKGNQTWAGDMYTSGRNGINIPSSFYKI